MKFIRDKQLNAKVLNDTAITTLTRSISLPHIYFVEKIDVEPLLLRLFMCL